MLSAFGKIFRNKRSKIALPEVEPPLMRALEPRVLLDAAAVETAQNMANEAMLDDVTEAVDADSQLPDEAHVPQDQKDVSRDVVFIDGKVDDIGAILTDLDPDIEVHILDLQSDGVQQIADILSDRTDLAAIHIFSHGGSGFLNLGTAQLVL